MDTKECSKCGEEKALTEFGKDKLKKDGHRGVCKVCRKPSVRKSAQKYYLAHKEDCLAKGKVRRDAVKDEWNKKRRERRANNAEWRELQNSRQRVANRERLKDPVKRQKQRDAVMRNYHKNKPAWRAAWAKYKAAKVSQTPSWANEQAIKAFYVEARRLEELTGIQFHVDHIIPLQGELVSGLHVETNLQLLPAHENIGKSNRFDPELFAA